MKSLILNVYFLVTSFNTREYYYCYYFESNIRLTLLIKVFLSKHHVMLFSSILNIKNKFVFVLVPYSIGAIWSKKCWRFKSVKSWKFRKKIKKGGRLSIAEGFKPTF